MKKRGLRRLESFGIVVLLCVAAVAGIPTAAPAEGRVQARQWQVLELSFASRLDYQDPFDFERVRFSVEFDGPGGRKLTMPGFWDGGSTWRVRFAPTAPGRWDYLTRCTNVTDTGLHGRQGHFDAASSSDETDLRKHGGFLAVSDDRRYLTYTDGTPFFWLADTWWRVPSAFVPFDDFKRMVDSRARLGFTVFQAHGHTGFSARPGFDVFQAIRLGGDAAVELWQEVDRYIGYAEASGMVGILGFAGIDLLDPISTSDLKKLWFYYLARYAAYPITFLITQEYNADIGAKQERVAKVLELGRFIRANDPYKRAMSVHPWIRSRDAQEARTEEWYDFAMLQGGHFHEPRCESYLGDYTAVPHRPILESELNYEGFERGRFKATASVIRDSAYTAMQCGSFGFSYGAQGLYAGVASKTMPGPTAKWGPILTWQEGLSLDGGRQLAHLRTLYESVEWWQLKPWPVDASAGNLLVKAAGHSTIVVYVRSANATRDPMSISGLPDDTSYKFRWFDPRTGDVRIDEELVRVQRGALLLTAVPSLDDWLLVATAVDTRGAP